MLPHEIDPFADSLIEDLEAMHQQIERVLAGDQGVLTQGNLIIWQAKLRSASRGLTRFKVCMADEVKQKERYAKYAKENGYPYS